MQKRNVLGAQWVLPFVLVACGSQEETPFRAETPAAQQAPVVYGEDNRLDVYEAPDEALQALARRSAVALMRPTALDASNPSKVLFLGQPLGPTYNLCPDERFRDDPTAAFCSGTLIDDDLVLTAGHCITSAEDCANVRFVFKYYRPAEGALETVTTDDVFSCQALVVRQQGLEGRRTLDFAIVRLDRPATPRFIPAPVRTAAAPLEEGEGVAVIGSGSGVPLKVDDGGTVRDPRADTLDYFIATTDTFAGNSGSGVYALPDHLLTGVLVRGELDYVLRGRCRTVNVCSESGCSGESITYVRPALDAFCQAATSARLCSPSESPR